MTRILASAVLTYQQETESLLYVVAPALVLGPIAGLTATSSLLAALVALPLLALLYLVTYAASVRAAGLVVGHLSPEPTKAYAATWTKMRGVMRLAAPGMLMLAAVAGSALFIADSGQPGAALILSGFGGATFFVWAVRHAYDLPLLLVHELDTRDVFRTGLSIFRASVGWNLLFVTTLTLPLLLAALAAWGLAVATSPPLGAAVFAFALAAWLPLPAFSLTAACASMVDPAD